MLDPALRFTSATLHDCPPQAVLIYGPRKGGTTLLQNLLDGGDELLMIPGELKLKRAVTRRIAPASFKAFFFELGRSYFLDLFASQCAGEAPLAFRFPPLSPERTQALFEVDAYRTELTALRDSNAADPRVLIRDDVGRFRGALRDGASSAYRCWGSKEVGGSPQHVLQLFRALFPEGKVVYIVRDPRFVVRAVLRNRRDMGWKVGPSIIERECWDAQRVIQYAATDAIGKEILVSYEALTHDPQATMARVARQLGISFDQRLLTPTVLGEPVVVDTASRQTTEIFQSDPNWQSELSQGEIACIEQFHRQAPEAFESIGERYVDYDEVLRRVDHSHTAAGSAGR